MDLGIQGVEIEDKIPLTQSDKEQMFVDILPQTEADDGVAYLSFYLEPEEDKEKILSDVRKELEEMSAYVNVGECLIEESETEDVDWENNWKQYFHPIKIGERLLIRPTWEDEYDAEGRAVLHLEPGLGEQLEAVFSPVLCRRCFDHSVMGRGKAGRRR